MSPTLLVISMTMLSVASGLPNMAPRHVYIRGYSLQNGVNNPEEIALFNLYGHPGVCHILSNTGVASRNRVYSGYLESLSESNPCKYVFGIKLLLGSNLVNCITLTIRDQTPQFASSPEGNGALCSDTYFFCIMQQPYWGPFGSSCTIHLNFQTKRIYHTDSRGAILGMSQHSDNEYDEYHVVGIFIDSEWNGRSIYSPKVREIFSYSLCEANMEL
jgi:hypothetical protein